MKRVVKIAMAAVLTAMTGLQAQAQVETPDVLTSDDATWSQKKVPSSDFGLSTDLNGKSSIKYKLVDASSTRQYPYYPKGDYSYDIVMELVHSNGTVVPVEYYHYDNHKGWSKKSSANDPWGTANGSVTTSNNSRGAIEGTVYFTYGQNGDKLRGSIKNTQYYNTWPYYNTWALALESYFTVFKVRTIRYDLYDDRELLGSGSNQNNLSDHTAPISVYVHRNLSSSNWSTLCLPFDIPCSSVEKVFGPGTIVSKFSNVDLQNHIINFYSAPVRNEGIKAGVPYLIKPGKNFTTDNPFFVTNVTISKDVQTQKTADAQVYGYNFCGLLQPTVIKDAVSASQVPVYISGNHLYKDTGTTPMKGFRAYFEFPSVYPDGTPAAPAKSMAFNIDGGMTTAVDRVAVDHIAGNAEVYNLQGQRVASSADNLPKGIYIINGREVMVK